MCASLGQHLRHIFGHHHCVFAIHCRQDVLDVWGQSWQQGCAGTASQLPCAEELLRPLHGSSRGLLALTPGRLLSHVGSQVSSNRCSHGVITVQQTSCVACDVMKWGGVSLLTGRQVQTSQAFAYTHNTLW